MKSNNNAPNQGKKTVYMLHIPGGGMLGVVPLRMLTELERLTELQSKDLFQAFEGVSTGAICVSSILNGYAADQTLERYKRDGQRFFKPIPFRNLKMMFTGAATNLLAGFDPLKRHHGNLLEIVRTSNKLIRGLDEKHHGDLKKLKDFAKSDIIIERDKRGALKICNNLLNDDKIDTKTRDLVNNMKMHIDMIEPSGNLSSVFYHVARKPIDFIIEHWAGDHYFSSETPKETFKNYYADRRLDKSPKTVYIASYNQEEGHGVHFSHRKDDLFANDPDASGITSQDNEYFWDATMASIAHPGAFKPHTTLSGKICTDRATLHTPTAAISDLINATKNKDVDIKLVYFGVGKYEERFNLLETIRQGLIGSFLDMSILTHTENYRHSFARMEISNLIGEDNMMIFNPHLTVKDLLKLQPKDASNPNSNKLKYAPSRDTLNADPENVAIMEKIAEGYLENPDVRANLHTLAADLCENLYNLGQIDAEHLKRVQERCIHAHEKVEMNSPQNQGNTPWGGFGNGIRKWFGGNGPE